MNVSPPISGSKGKRSKKPAEAGDKLSHTHSHENLICSIKLHSLRSGKLYVNKYIYMLLVLFEVLTLVTNDYYLLGCEGLFAG
jgi:hypothetical protein